MSEQRPHFPSMLPELVFTVAAFVGFIVIFLFILGTISTLFETAVSLVPVSPMLIVSHGVTIILGALMGEWIARSKMEGEE